MFVEPRLEQCAISTGNSVAATGWPEDATKRRTIYSASVANARVHAFHVLVLYKAYGAHCMKHSEGVRRTGAERAVLTTPQTGSQQIAPTLSFSCTETSLSFVYDFTRYAKLDLEDFSVASTVSPDRDQGGRDRICRICASACDRASIPLSSSSEVARGIDDNAQAEQHSIGSVA